MISLAQKWHSVRQKWRSDYTLTHRNPQLPLTPHIFAPLGEFRKCGYSQIIQVMDDHLSIETYSMVTTGDP
jgi:hypothetical protein